MLSDWRFVDAKYRCHPLQSRDVTCGMIETGACLASSDDDIAVTASGPLAARDLATLGRSRG